MTLFRQMDGSLYIGSDIGSKLRLVNMEYESVAHVSQIEAETKVLGYDVASDTLVVSPVIYVLDIPQNNEEYPDTQWEHYYNAYGVTNIELPDPNSMFMLIDLDLNRVANYSFVQNGEVDEVRFFRSVSSSFSREAEQPLPEEPEMPHGTANFTTLVSGFSQFGVRVEELMSDEGNAAAPLFGRVGLLVLPHPNAWASFNNLEATQDDNGSDGSYANLRCGDTCQDRSAEVFLECNAGPCGR